MDAESDGSEGEVQTEEPEEMAEEELGMSFVILRLGWYLQCFTVRLNDERLDLTDLCILQGHPGD